MRPAIIMVVLSLCFGVARAQGGEDARTLFERGTALYALHRFADAAIQFEKAFEVKPDPAILYNAAQAHRLAGNKQRALELYESLVKLYPQQRANRAEVNEHIKQLRSAIDAERKATSAPPVEPAPLPQRTEPTPPVAPPPPAVVSEPAPAATPAPAPAVTASVTSEAPARKPVYKKAWFWAVIGGAAAAVAVGVGVGVAFGSTTTNPTPSYGVVNGN